MNNQKIIDMHCDTLLECYAQKQPLRKNNLHIDLEKLREGGSLLQFFAIFMCIGESAELRGVTQTPYELFLSVHENYMRELEENRDIIAPVKSFDDIEKNSRQGKISSLLTIEDSGLLEGQAERLQTLYDKGVRLMTLLWNHENCLGFPQNRDPQLHQKGLKNFGIEMVERMNELGIIVDVSHLSEGGFYDVAKHSKKPFVATHSCARTLCNHPRNLTDDQLKCIAEAGGVVGVNFYAPFLKDNAEVSKIDDIIEHTEYMIRLIGDDYVALGSDFDGVDCEMQLQNYAYYPKLIEEMEKRFSCDTVEKICSRNVLRVLKECL